MSLAPNARVIRVGKRGGCKSTPQAFIQRLMIRYARKGLHVVRAKGGDALLFGRAGEEIAALREVGIEVDIVNGVSSGFAAAGLGTTLAIYMGMSRIMTITASLLDALPSDRYACGGRAERGLVEGTARRVDARAHRG